MVLRGYTQTMTVDYKKNHNISDYYLLNNNHKMAETKLIKRKNAEPNRQSDKTNIENSPQEKTHKTVYIVFVSLLLDLLAFTMILPLLPSLLDHYKMNDSIGLYQWLSSKVEFFQELVGAPVRFNSVLFGGFLGSMFSFLQFVASPIVGGLSDVYGRKPVLLVCLVGIASSYVLWALSSNFAVFVLARFIGGISKGNVSLSMAIITDVSTSKTRGKGMALVGIAFSLGFIVGPMIGAFFSRFSDKTTTDWFVGPALFALCLSLADLLFVIACFKETLPKEKRSKGVATSMSHALSHISIPELFRFSAVTDLSSQHSTELRRLGLVYFLYLFLYSGLEFTLTFLTHHTFNYTSMQQGMMFFAIGVVMAFFQGGLVRRLPEGKMKASAVAGLWIIVPSFLCVGISPLTSLYMLYFGLFLFAVSTAFVVPSLTTIASRYGGSEQKGTVLGVFRSLGALARALGPVAASIAFWCIGCTPTYLIGGILLFFPVLMLRQSNIR